MQFKGALHQPLLCILLRKRTYPTSTMLADAK
jgi:hypothetical protein